MEITYVNHKEITYYEKSSPGPKGTSGWSEAEKPGGNSGFLEAESSPHEGVYRPLPRLSLHPTTSPVAEREMLLCRSL